MSSAKASSVASSALVRRMKPPSDSVRVTKRWRSASRWAGGIFCDTPMCWSWGKYTNKRPAMLICEVSRAPLVPIGSLSTCTKIAWPSKICFSMASAGSAMSWPASLLPSVGLARACLAAMLGNKSATCKNAARSKPMSMKADCMPGKTRETLPKYTLPTKPRSKVRSWCTSCTTPCSITATRVSCGDQLMRMSCPMVLSFSTGAGPLGP